MWLQLESHEHPYYPRLQTGSKLMRGFVGAARFPLFAGTNISKCILQRLGSLLLGQVKALLDALLGVWKDVAFVKNKSIKTPVISLHVSKKSVGGMKENNLLQEFIRCFPLLH